MKPLRVLVLSGVWTALLVFLLQAAEGSEKEPLKVLFVGNSYTQRCDLPQIVRQMARETGDGLETSKAVR